MIVLKKPILTEKSMAKTADGKYTFLVDRNANKHQIKKFVEVNFKVNVIKINIINYKGEIKLKKGRYKVKTRDYSKAIVTLLKDQKMPGFEEK